MLRKPWVTLTLVIRIHSSYVYASVRVFETSHSKYFRWYWWWLLNKQTNKHYHYVPLIMCNQCLKEQAYPGKCRRAGRPARRRTRCSAPTPRCCPWPRAPPHSPLRRISVESPITWDRWVKFAFSLVPKSRWILIQASPLRVSVGMVKKCHCKRNFTVTGIFCTSRSFYGPKNFHCSRNVTVLGVTVSGEARNTHRYG